MPPCCAQHSFIADSFLVLRRLAFLLDRRSYEPRLQHCKCARLISFCGVSIFVKHNRCLYFFPSNTIATLLPISGAREPKAPEFCRLHSSHWQDVMQVPRDREFPLTVALFRFCCAAFWRRLVDVLHLCAMLLSQNQCTRLLSMPGLVEIAAESLTGSMEMAEVGVRSCHLTRSRASR